VAGLCIGALPFPLMSAGGVMGGSLLALFLPLPLGHAAALSFGAGGVMVTPEGPTDTLLLGPGEGPAPDEPAEPLRASASLILASSSLLC